MNECRLEVCGQRISTFCGIKDTEIEYIFIDLSNNCLRDFEHFGTHPRLVELRLQNNRIESFRGLTRQPSLAVIDLYGNPIASHPLYRIMALLVVGFSIKIIDGALISKEELELARSMGPSAALAVSYGWNLELGQRSLEEYRQIIDKCKKSRRESCYNDGSFRKISQVLKENNNNKIIRSLINKESEIVSSSNIISLQQLSSRINQLEKELFEAKEELKLQQNQRKEVINFAIIDGLTTAELRSARSIIFIDGIYFNTNILDLSISGNNGRICGSLMFEASSLVFLSFMSRVRLAQLPLSDIQVRHHQYNSLCIQGRYGATFDILFEDFYVFSSVYKLLYIRRGLPVPPLKPNNNNSNNEIYNSHNREIITEKEINKWEIGSNSSNILTEEEKFSKNSSSSVENTEAMTSFYSPENSFKLDATRNNNSPSPVAQSVSANTKSSSHTVEDILQVHTSDDGFENKPILDTKNNNIRNTDKDNHDNDASNAKTSLQRKQISQPQQQPPLKNPSRRYSSSTSAPRIPSRLASFNENFTVLREISVRDSKLKSEPPLKIPSRRYSSSTSAPRIPSRLASFNENFTVLREISVRDSKLKSEPPLKIPSRRYSSSTSAPRIPSRLASRAESLSMLQIPSTLNTSVKSSETHLRHHILRFRIAYSDSESLS